MITTIDNSDREALNMPIGDATYTDEQISSATTLHFYGTKAYEYLSTKLNLPSTRTLRRRLCQIDGSPGRNKCMLDTLRKCIEEDPNTSTNVACMINAMFQTLPPM
ncbi:DNA transposase THAP9 [Biomphalaria glabrata]|nr:DNA transposase THAP9 [Biomphalaria glabrata]